MNDGHAWTGCGDADDFTPGPMNVIGDPEREGVVLVDGEVLYTAAKVNALVVDAFDRGWDEGHDVGREWVRLPRAHKAIGFTLLSLVYIVGAFALAIVIGLGVEAWRLGWGLLG